MSEASPPQNPHPSPLPEYRARGQEGKPSLPTAKEPWLYHLGRIPCRLFTTLWFDLKVYGADLVPKRGGVLIASNHQSNLDPVLVAVKLQRPLSFMAKASLFEKPAFSWLIRSLNAFPVRLGEGDVGAVKETIRRLEEGHALNIFPEGTRTEDGEISPIQPGIGLIARRAGVPVVPAVIDGSFDAMPRGSSGIRRVPIRVMFGPPLKLEGMKAGEMVKRIDATLRSMLEELRQRDPLLQEAKRRRHGA